MGLVARHVAPHIQMEMILMVGIVVRAEHKIEQQAGTDAQIVQKAA